MRPLSALTADDISPIEGVVFDLDDTLLDHGSLSESAYRALFRLKEAGFRLIGATGRPFGWIDVLARQWPVDIMIAENGAAAVIKTPSGGLSTRIDESANRRNELLDLAARLTAKFTNIKITSDNFARATDVTLDIGESHKAPRETVLQMCEMARAEGVVTVTSSVHLHLSHTTPDKAAGIVRVLGDALGEDPTTVLQKYAFIGDSGNDATAFAAFKLTFGVANVKASAASLTIPPRFIAPSSMGRGFVEIAATLVALRGSNFPTL